MLIYKTKNVLSKLQTNFINDYTSKNNNRNHIIIIELSLKEFIDIKEKETTLEIDPILKKRVSNFRFDVYDKTVDTVFEIQGSQHYNFNSFFYSDSTMFDRQKGHDYLKKVVCDFFDVKFVEIK